MNKKLLYSCMLLCSTLANASDISLDSTIKKTATMTFETAINVGQSSTQQFITVTNNADPANKPLPIIFKSAFSAEGTNASDFAINSPALTSGGCSGILEAGNSCKIGVTFKPTVAGTLTAKLVISEDSTVYANLSGTGQAQPPVDQCSATTLSACKEQKTCESVAGVWSTTTNQCAAATTTPTPPVITTPTPPVTTPTPPVDQCSATTLSACKEQKTCESVAGVWSTTTNQCAAATTTPTPPVTTTPTPPVDQCSATTLSACKEQKTCESVAGVWNATTNQCSKSCPTGEESVNGACVSILKKGAFSLMPFALKGDPATSPQTTTATFFGGISIDGDKTFSKEVTFSKTIQGSKEISVKGLIVPDTNHQGMSAEIIAVGLYVPETKPDGSSTNLPSTPSKAYCDSSLGNFYMNTAGESFSNNYCFWISKGGETTANCNPNPRRVATLESHLMDGKDLNQFWTPWNGHLDKDHLKPMYSNISLDSNGVSKLLYKDTVNYTGQVCIYFGYRLADQTLVFNGEPIIFRVSQ